MTLLKPGLLGCHEEWHKAAAFVDTLVALRLMEKDPQVLAAHRAMEKVQEAMNAGTLEDLGETFVWLEHGPMFDKPGKDKKDRLVLKIVGSVEIEGQNGPTQVVSVAKAVMQLLKSAGGCEKKQGKAPMGDIERKIQAKVYKKRR